MRHILLLIVLIVVSTAESAVGQSRRSRAPQFDYIALQGSAAGHNGSSRQGMVAADVLPAAVDRIPARAVVGRGIRYNGGRDEFSSNEPTVSRRSLPSG